MLDIKKYNDYIAPEQRIDNKITGDILFQAIYHDIIYGDDSIMYISKYINDRFDKITDILSLEMRISYKHFLINMNEKIDNFILLRN